MAYPDNGGCDPDAGTPAYYAVGSAEPLGTSGSAVTTLYTTNGGQTYHLGRCDGHGFVTDNAGWSTVAADGVDATTGGMDGKVVTVDNASALLDAISKEGAYVIRVSGRIDLPAGTHPVGSDKSIIGMGADALIQGGGLSLAGAHNIIIRSLQFADSADHAIIVEAASHHIWIDHCSFSGATGAAINIRGGASYITVSWNRFSLQDLCCTIGHSDDDSLAADRLKVTFHHNYFYNTRSDHPNVWFGQVHVFDNYYTGNENGIISARGARVLVEGNYFGGVANPTLVGLTYEAPGLLVIRNNTFFNCGEPQTNGSVPDPPYQYQSQGLDSLPAMVSGGAGAGRI